MNNQPQVYYTPYQLKLPLEISTKIEISDPVYTFSEVMEHGYCSVREIEKLCKTDIRFMWLLQDNPAPCHMTIDNFINNSLSSNIENIFEDINKYIFYVQNVDLKHIYIDGTKISANANKYSRVWKKSCVKKQRKAV